MHHMMAAWIRARRWRSRWEQLQNQTRNIFTGFPVPGAPADSKETGGRGERPGCRCCRQP